MNLFKRFVAVFLSLAVPLCMLPFTAFANEQPNDAEVKSEDSTSFDGVLRCGKDGEFRILTFTDIHIDKEGTELDEQTVAFMADAIKVADPQLVVFTGDMTNPDGTDTLEHLKRSIKVGLSAVKEAGIPFALVFGNHDLGNIPEEMRQSDVPDKAALIALYAEEAEDLLLNTWAINNDDKLVTQYNDESGGVTNFNYPIYSTDGSEVINNLYFFDEGSTQGTSQYAGVMPDQSEWYKNTSKMLTESNNGEAVPSLVFQHTIVPEIYDAFAKGAGKFFEDYMTKTVGDQSYVFFPDFTKIDGVLLEWPCPPSFETDQYEAWVEGSDVMMAAFGHDHTNNFTYETEEGITLVGMPSTSLLRGTIRSRGATMFTISENKENIKTYKQTYISYQYVKAELGEEATVSRTYGTSSELRLIIYAIHEMWKTFCVKPYEWIKSLF